MWHLAVAKPKKINLLTFSQSLNFIVQNDLQECDENSSPIFGSKYIENLERLGDFFTDQKKVWQKMVAQQKFPFKKCRLVHHRYNLKKRWYIIFYAWNVATEQLERKRIFEPINRKKTVQQRLEVAEYIMVQTNGDLARGKVLGKSELKAITSGLKVRIDQLTLLKALDYFVKKKGEEKMRTRYTKRFGTIRNHIETFYEANGLDDVPIKTAMQYDFVESLFDYFRSICKSNKTFNNYRSDISIMYNWLNKKCKPKKLFDENPVKNIDKLRVVARKHAAYNDDQLKLILQECDKNGYHQLSLFIYFMYYTLAREPEILSIRRRDIDFTNSRIAVLGEDAKNWRDEYVSMNARFKQIIIDARIMEGPPEEYIFGVLLKPGTDPHPNANYFINRMRKILNSTGLRKINPRYSLYSVKHSGAIALYQATKDVMAIKEQARWKSIQQAQDYLRDLGLIRNSPVLEWNGAI